MTAPQSLSLLPPGGASPEPGKPVLGEWLEGHFASLVRVAS